MDLPHFDSVFYSKDFMNRSCSRSGGLSELKCGSGILAYCQSSVRFQIINMNSTVSKATDKNASRLFRPWDTETASSHNIGGKSEKVDMEDTDTIKEEMKAWRVPPLEWTDALEAYWTSWASNDIPGLNGHSRAPSNKLRPKRFRCPHCDVAFSNNGQLKGHVRIHTGERPFRCEADGCGKSFTRNEELTRHKRIHSGVRPFSCNECGKCFGRKDHLKKHSRTHLPSYAEMPPSFYVYPYLFTY